mgnify:CR=1 FL=1
MLSLVFSKSAEDPFNEAIARWVMERTHMHRVLIPRTYTAIGVIRVGSQQEPKVIAGVLFHDFSHVGSGARIEVSMAADDPCWARRGVISWLSCALRHDRSHQPQDAKIPAGLGLQGTRHHSEPTLRRRHRDLCAAPGRCGALGAFSN